MIHRIAERLHWSVRARCEWPDALVDGIGKARYAPANLAAVMGRLTDADIARPTALELRLITAQRKQAVAATCSLEAQGGTCRCCEPPSVDVAAARPAAAMA